MHYTARFHCFQLGNSENTAWLKSFIVSAAQHSQQNWKSFIVKQLEELKSFAELQQELKTQQSSIWKCCLKFPQLCHSKERESIEKQYRGLSVKFHPDKGGEEDDMKVLNACRDKLLEHSGA